jgi:hypothetical protein
MNMNKFYVPFYNEEKSRIRNLDTLSVERELRELPPSISTQKLIIREIVQKELETREQTMLKEEKIRVQKLGTKKLLLELEGLLEATNIQQRTRRMAIERELKYRDLKYSIIKKVCLMVLMSSLVAASYFLSGYSYDSK